MRQIILDALKPDTVHGLEYYRAIGYLSTWGETAKHVSIFNDGKEGLIAYYRYTPDDKFHFVIGAVWNGQECKYSFHS